MVARFPILRDEWRLAVSSPLYKILREVCYDGLPPSGWRALAQALQASPEGEDLTLATRYLHDHIQRMPRDLACLPWGLWRMTNLRQEQRFEPYDGSEGIHEDRWDSSAAWEERGRLEHFWLYISPEERFCDNALRPQWVRSSWAAQDGVRSEKEDSQRYFQGQFYARRPDRQEALPEDEDGFLKIHQPPKPSTQGQTVLFAHSPRQGEEIWDVINWDGAGLSRERRMRAKYSQTRYTMSYELICTFASMARTL